MTNSTSSNLSLEPTSDALALTAQFETLYAALQPEERATFLVQALEITPEHSSLMFKHLLQLLENPTVKLAPELWNKASKAAITQGLTHVFHDLLKYAPPHAEFLYFDALTEWMTEHTPRLIGPMFDGILRYSKMVPGRVLALHEALLMHAPSWSLDLKEAKLVQASWSALRYRPNLTSMEIRHVWSDSMPQVPESFISPYGRLALSGLIEMEVDILKNSGGWVQVVYVEQETSDAPKPVRIDEWILQHPIWRDALDSTDLEKLLLDAELPTTPHQKSSVRI